MDDDPRSSPPRPRSPGEKPAAAVLFWVVFVLIPGPPNRWFLVVFGYLKSFQKPPVGGTGIRNMFKKTVLWKVPVGGNTGNTL